MGVWMLNRRRDIKEGKNVQLASTALDSYIREDVERMKKMKLHRGLRHYWYLKVRGQMTKNTGRGVARGYDIKEDRMRNWWEVIVNKIVCSRLFEYSVLPI